MDNLLPPFKTFSLDGQSVSSTISSHAQGKSFASSSKWQPKDLDTLPSYLDEPKRPYYQEEVPSYQRNVLPPNDRYSDPVDPLISELSVLHRGVAAEAKISSIPKPKSKYPMKRYDNKVSKKYLSINLESRLSIPMDLCISSTTKVDTIPVQPNTVVSRPVLTPAVLRDPAYDNYSDVYALISTPKVVTINMTNRQEIRDFDFYDGPIGLEVESQYGKITVTKVVEGSQAASYGTVLVGAEIVAVNEQRVITLEEFQNAVLVARSMGFLITIKAASYKGARLKIDDLYAYNFKGTGKTGGVASLLSNIMTKGLDKDHQHGVELPTVQDEEEEEEEDDDVDNTAKIEKNEEKEEKDFKRDFSQFEEKEVGLEGRTVEAKFTSADRDDTFDPIPAYEFDDEKEHFVARKKIGNGIHSNDNFQEGAYSPALSVDGRDELKRDNESKPWEYLTGVTVKSEESDISEEDMDVGDIFAYRSLICVPNFVALSQRWRQSSKFMCINNCSSNWQAELFWVDPNSALVRRGRIRKHASFFDRTSEDYVWLLLVYHVDNVEKGSRSPSRAKSRDGERDCDDDDDFVNVNLDDPEVHVFKGPLTLILRASQTCFSESSTVVITWTPWVSFNITRRVNAVESNPRLDKFGGNTGMQASETPHIILNIFDIPKRYTTQNEEN